MEGRTKEEKVQIIRALINNDNYTDAMSEEDVDDVMLAIQSPVRRMVNSIYKRVKRIVEKIPEEVLKQMGR